jgi:hypothetical protein
MSPGTLATKIPDWRTWICGAWLIKVGDTVISTVDEVMKTFKLLSLLDTPSTVLLFAHLEIRPNLTHDGLPIVSSAPFTQQVHDQLNNQWEFTTVADYLRTCAPSFQHVDS